MKTLPAASMAFSVALSASTAMAGGPVVIEEDVEVVAEKSGSSMGILPIIIVGIALCAALCGDDGDDDDDDDDA